MVECGSVQSAVGTVARYCLEDVLEREKKTIKISRKLSTETGKNIFK